MLQVYYQRFLGAIPHDRMKAVYAPLTHCFVRKVAQMSFDEVFREMQGEIWSPNGEVRRLITHLNLHHTSMSIGDIICGANNELWVCSDPSGWLYLGPVPASSDTLWFSREADRIKIVSDRDCLSSDVLTVEQFVAIEFKCLVEIAGYIEKWGTAVCIDLGGERFYESAKSN